MSAAVQAPEKVQIMLDRELADQLSAVLPGINTHSSRVHHALHEFIRSQSLESGSVGGTHGREQPAGRVVSNPTKPT